MRGDSSDAAISKKLSNAESSNQDLGSDPSKCLEGFKRITLQPGETKTLAFPLGKKGLQFWDPESKRWVVEPSEFDVWAGKIRPLASTPSSW
jgi:Fibronectin type III-like domain